jgi:hypothetical protein
MRTAEVAVHPSDTNDVHEFYLMCDDVEAIVGEMKKRNIACAPVQDLGWGLLTRLTLPGGGKLGVNQPRHMRPKGMHAESEVAPPRRGDRCTLRFRLGPCKPSASLGRPVPLGSVMCALRYSTHVASGHALLRRHSIGLAQSGMAHDPPSGA